MTNPKMVNIGTKENPILVSVNKLKRNTKEGNHFWSRVATGSQLPPNEEVFKLIEKPNDNKAQEG